MGVHDPVVMGVHQSLAAADPREAIRREAHGLRSAFLDSCARIEAAVQDYLTRLNIETKPTSSFAVKLQALAKARDQFRHPARLDARIKELAELSACRNDIVHSILAVATIWDGLTEQHWLVFRKVATPDGRPLLLNPDALKAMTVRAKTLAHQFSQQPLKAPAPAAPAPASG